MKKEEYGLKEGTAIVTGAGRGVGAAIAKTLATAGVRVTVNDINPDRAERVTQEIGGTGGEAIAVQADVANRFQCVKLVEATRAQWGRLDALINAAHITPKGTVLKMGEWDWNRCMEVNVKGVFFMSQLCGRVMDDSRRGGVMVNVISEAGVRVPFENRAAYCASQAAVMGFARECAREFAAYGVRVHTLLRDDDQDGSDDVAKAVLALCAGSIETQGTPLTAPEARKLR
jgi:NAD(P)-dependent dehydrogenase (short-subunit alcohol dehydrogenase family)